ncbi:MAG TPA: glycosyltransferase [Spirochaetota bacterium]|nr:glycosyltransferase [Spirochaetota bacterium]HPR47779.1 glycosyltransferase [Spirochaetota bacterium]
MKILFLTNVIPFPADNGKKMRTMSFIKSLSKEHVIDLIAINSENIIDKKKYTDLSRYVNSIYIVRSSAGSYVMNVIKRLMCLFMLYPYSVYKSKSVHAANKIREFLNKNKYDCIFCDGLHITVNLFKINGTIIIINEHNIEYLIYKRYVLNEKNLLKKFYAMIEMHKLQRYEQLQWKKMDHGIVCSDIDGNIIKEYDPCLRVTIIPNTIDVASYGNITEKQVDSNILFLGALDWIPNQDAVIFFFDKIYPLVKKKVSHVSFTVVGRNPTKKIKNLSKLDSSVKVTGTVDDVRPYLAQCAVFVVPLRMGSGTRLKILEAMAMKKVVVSTTIGAEGLEVTDNLDIVIADEPADIAEKIIEIFHNNELKRRIIQNSYNLVSCLYDSKIINKKFNSFFP